MIRLWQVKRWLSRLLVRLGIKKQGVMVPGAFEKLFKSGLRKDFEAAYKDDWPPSLDDLNERWWEK